jgi:ribosomal protein S18 acetylase RimI-like enzyme
MLVMSNPTTNFPVIRRCLPEEAEAVLALWRESGATVSSTDTVADLRLTIADSPAWVLVAESGGGLVGSVIGSFDGWRANLYRLAVHPEYRRRGLARALVMEVTRRLADEGARRVSALVEKDHPLAMNFWRGIGYQLDARMVRFVHHCEAPVRGGGGSEDEAR